MNWLGTLRTSTKSLHFAIKHNPIMGETWRRVCKPGGRNVKDNLRILPHIPWKHQVDSFINTWWPKQCKSFYGFTRKSPHSLLPLPCSLFVLILTTMLEEEGWKHEWERDADPAPWTPTHRCWLCVSAGEGLREGYKFELLSCDYDQGMFYCLNIKSQRNA